MLRVSTFISSITFLLVTSTSALADGPADNDPHKVRRVPRLGIEVPAAERAELKAGIEALAKSITRLQSSKDPKIRRLLPDVQIFYRAVHDALKYREFFAAREIKSAFKLLKEGFVRAKQLERGKAPWTIQTGLVVRGYVSKIDGSVQPYGLVIPKSYDSNDHDGYRLDLWFHGRGETLSEVNFLTQRQSRVGTFAPPNAIVLHPYGRYSNANHFAGEIDVLEAMESVKQRYRVDPERISVRGFSMGGASTWAFAVHYPGRWAGANPGAGFSETPEFLRFFQKETLKPTWYERKLWHLYDCTDWATNLYHCPTVAYSGELDIQKQAADVMEKALRKQGIALRHIIGPKTKHRYHPKSRDKVEQLMSQIIARGRQRVPRNIHFVTYTLRYNRLRWLIIDALDEHWEKARVDASIRGNVIELRPKNVAQLTVDFAPGDCPFNLTKPTALKIEGKTLKGPLLNSDRSWSMTAHRIGDDWKPGPAPTKGLRKRHLLQGPIDDAFMDSFIFVRPSGKCATPKVNAWVEAELARAIEHWRRHFRGDARVKMDTEITEEDIAQSNLVLWGDPLANKLLAKIADRLPINYVEGKIAIAAPFSKTYSSDHHVPTLIYPNPLNPKKYVVLNSSFTYRDYSYLNTARQTPKLPDWAIIDVRTPPNSLWPGQIVAADFFGERWEIRPPRKAR